MVAHYCPVLLPLDYVNVLALAGIVRVVGKVSLDGPTMLVGAEGKGYLKIDVENLVESKLKDKSLPVLSCLRFNNSNPRSWSCGITWDYTLSALIPLDDWDVLALAKTKWLRKASLEGPTSSETSLRSSSQ